MQGDDYFVKEIALLYTEFKKMQGHVVQAPNSYLNTLFILNQRRSGPLAEAVPIIIKFGTTLQQIEQLRHRLLEFVRSEKREFDGNILTELREVTENYSITLNIVFFYKSNWQNELLRLQRRNKFICNLMLCLQETGIEGPRMNLAGFQDTNPMFLNHQSAPPQYSASTDPADPNNPESRDGVGELNTNANAKPAGILRTRANTGSSRHARKNVDFSLGMSDMSIEDPTADVFEDRTSRVNDVMRNANRNAANRREQELRDDEAERQSAASSRGRRSVDTGTGASTGFAGGAPSITSSVTRNRFLGRFSRSTRGDGESSRKVSTGPSMRPLRSNEEDLMEQGRFPSISQTQSQTQFQAGGLSPSPSNVPGRDRGDLHTWPSEPPHSRPQSGHEAEQRDERPVEMREYLGKQ